MKKLFIYSVSAAIATLAFTSCSSEEESLNPSGPKEKVSFTNAQMYYYADDFGTGAGSYGISLYKGVQQNPDVELYFDFTSTPYTDVKDAVPAMGEYRLSNSYDQFTFNEDYSWYFKSDSHSSSTHYIVDGRFSFREDGDDHYVHFEVELANGTILTGDFRGEIVGMNSSRGASATRARATRAPASQIW